jgi:hypothetical protein
MGRAAPMWVNANVNELLIASLRKPQNKCGVAGWVFYIVSYITLSSKF